jgi:FAD/FMN-containing dehydrogenase
VIGRGRSKDDEGWSDSVLVWNGLVASVPALVVRPASAEEVSAAVAFAREHGLRVDVARGRDVGAGREASERRLTLDLSDGADKGHAR